MSSEHGLQQIENEFHDPPLMNMLQGLILENSDSIHVQRESKLLIKSFKKYGNEN